MATYANAQYIDTVDYSGRTIRNIRCTLDGRTITVPVDTKNADYHAIMQLVNAGSLSIAGP
jgi:hypothetical protein